MAVEHVEGKKNGRVMLYALSTCVWCRMTKKLLGEIGVAYDYTFVDLLEGTERESAIQEVRRWNPAGSFPTLIIDDKAIVGYQEEKIRGALNHG